MKQFDTTGYALNTIHDGIQRTCWDYEVSLLKDFALLPLCSIGHLVFGFDQHEVYVVNPKEGDPVRMFSLEGDIEGLRINPIEFMDMDSGSKVWVFAVQADYSWGTDMYYFTR